MITGLSGSGKSSLAFDTLYAEGQRRYVESLSAYARQFLQIMEKPDVDLDRRAVARDLDRAEGDEPQSALDRRHGHRDPRLPAAAVRARRRSALPRSQHQAAAQSVSQMVDHVLALPEDTRLMILSPLIVGPQGRAGRSVRGAARAGLRARAHRRQGARASTQLPKLDEEHEAHRRGGGRPR